MNWIEVKWKDGERGSVNTENYDNRALNRLQVYKKQFIKNSETFKKIYLNCRIRIHQA